jgi:eukaryotic-like serine/threonine-protein kinase
MNATTTQPQRLGRYALYDRIASGGMATVYFGQLVGTGGFSRIVAVKRLHPHLAEEKEFASMLLDEAYLAGRIRHPNVVQTLDIVSADKELFVVMDYVHGETLGRLMKTATTEGKAIPIDVAVAILVGVLNGLHAAHETTNEQGEPLRIVHRDVSPQNVVVGVDGIPRLLDFGVAKAQYRLHTTQDGQIKGKLAYMAVEQLTNQTIDRRADIYGAGVILWELLSGRRLFAGETESSTMHIILSGNHPRPSTIVPAVPAALDAITMKALSRNPANRYETARQMALALEQATQVATSTTVGEWVATLGEPQLAERAKIMREIDARHGARGDDKASQDALAEDVAFEPSMVRRHGSMAETLPFVPVTPLAQKKKPLLYVAAGAAGVLLIAVTLVARMSADKNRPAETARGAAASSTTVATSASASPPETGSTVAPSPAPPDSALAAGATSAAAHPHMAPPSSRPHTGARVGTPKAGKPDCNPPYTVDDIGVRHYKPECSP